MTLLDGLIEVGVLALLLLAPLPYGAVVPWAEVLVEGAVALLLALVAVRMLLARQVTIRWSPLLLPAAAMVVVAVAQIALPGRGSVNRWATWESLRLYLAYVGLLVVLGSHLTTRARVVRAVALLTGGAAVLAAVGLLGRVLGRPPVPWLAGQIDMDRLTATFINPNHQALYFAVAFFLALGLLVRPGRAGVGGRPVPSSTRPAASRAASLAGQVALLAELGVLGVALVLTLSRGGLLGFAAGLVVVGLLGARGRLGRWTAALVGAVAVGGLLALWFGAQPLLDRLASPSRDPFADIRWAVYDRTLRMAGEAPLLGFGLGTYRDVFTRFQPPGVPVGKIVDHAHNDYLQLAAEAGLAGVLVLGWTLIGLVGFTLPRWSRRHDPFVRGLVLGALAALGAVVVHSGLDFGLRVPANALMTVFLGALLVNGVTLRTQRGAGGGVDLPGPSWSVTGWRRAGGLAAVAAGLAAAAVVLVPAGLSGWEARRAEVLAGGRARDAGRVAMVDLVHGYRALARAAALEPRSPSVQANLAEVAEQIAVRVWTYGLSPEGRVLPRSPEARLAASQAYFASALAAYRTALHGNPAGAALHDRYGGFLVMLEGVVQKVKGSVRLRLDDPALAALVEGRETLFPEALAHLREAARLDPLNPYRHRNLAAFALTHLKGEEASAVATASLRRTLELEPRLLDDVVERLEAAGAPRSLVADALPARDDTWLALAQLWEKRGRREAAGWAFEQALTHATAPARQVEARIAYGRYLLATGHPRDALEQTRLALVLEPRNDRTFEVLAAVYDAMGQTNEAVQALASAIAVVEGVDRGRALGYRDRLATLHFVHRQFDQALAVRRRMLDDLPHDVGLRFQIARILEAQDVWPEALREYEAAVSQAPGDVELKRHVAEALARHGMAPRAIAMLEQVLDANPGLNEIRLSLARLYAHVGQPQQAAQQYREILARQPDHPEARRALAAVRVLPAGGAGR